MGFRGSRAAAAVGAAVLAAGVVAAGTGTASAAAPAGRVCMFDAPDGAYGLGHVAWSYRSAGGDGWGYGATLSSRNWRKHGSEQQMLHDFSTLDESGGYRGYRCKDTAAADDDAADATVTAGFARPYQLATDNCLTRSIQIFKVYDGSGGLKDLDDGKFTFPNAYFDYALPGWGPETKL